jgi:hypothetical protein
VRSGKKCLNAVLQFNRKLPSIEFFERARDHARRDRKKSTSTPAPCTVAPCTLHPAPCTLHPAPTSPTAPAAPEHPTVDNPRATE